MLAQKGLRAIIPCRDIGVLRSPSAPDIRAGLVRLCDGGIERGARNVVGGFILAAGEGRRLRPTTLGCAKSLVPFCGVPLLELAASRLSELSLGGIAVNSWYRGEEVARVTAALVRQNDWNLRLSPEPYLLGTGGGLRAGATLLPDCDHILVHNADVVLDYDLSHLVHWHLARNAAATLLLVPGRGPRTVDIDPGGQVVDLRRSAGEGRYTFTGVHVLRRDVLDLLPDAEACSIIPAFEAAMAQDRPVLGLVLQAGDFWADVGTAGRYVKAHGEIADCAVRYHQRLRLAQAEQARRRSKLEASGVRCTGALGLGRDIDVAPGAHVHNVVLWEGTRLTDPILYADGVFTGREHPRAQNTDGERVPDQRLLRSLDIERSDATLTPLLKQGSGRRYRRLASEEKSWVWCAYDPHRQENAGFSTLADFLKRLGVRVPDVLLHLPDVGEFVSRDLGQHVLQHVTLSDPERQTYLRQVAAQVARLHVLGERAARFEELPLQRGFTKGLYDWERDYFREHILDRLLGQPDLWDASVAQEYRELRTLLLSQPPVPIHRDLQSANIMVVGGEAYLIDFQGMRLGSAGYDLASFLYDPYQCYPRHIRRGIWEHYRGSVVGLGGVPPADDVLYAAAVQRLLQALGAYSKLWLQDDLVWYRRFIVPGLRMLLAANGESDLRPAFHKMGEACLAAATEMLGEGDDEEGAE